MAKMSSGAGAIDRFQPPGAATRLGANMEISVTKLQLPWLHWCGSMSQCLTYPQPPDPEMPGPGLHGGPQSHAQYPPVP